MEILGAVDQSQFLRLVGDFATLVEEVQAAIEALPDFEQPDHLLRHYDEVQNVVERLLHVGSGNMDQFRDNLSDRAMYGVEMCAYALNRNGGNQPFISADDAKKLEDLVRELINEV